MWEVPEVISPWIEVVEEQKVKIRNNFEDSRLWHSSTLQAAQTVLLRK